MAGLWHLSFCILFINLSVCRAIHSQEKQAQQITVSALTRAHTGNGLELSASDDILDRGKVRRRATDCSVLETGSAQGLQTIIDAEAKTRFRFFIQPQSGFNSLVFRVKLDNKLTPGSWKYFDESLIVRSSQIDIDWSHSKWIPVEIEYLKSEISFGPDRHTLRVRVGQDVREELTTRWWRTHSYEGFTVQADGPLKVLLKCTPMSATARPIADGKEVRLIVIIACIVGGCFLVVMGAATLYLLVAGRFRSLQNSQDDPPPVPTSTLRGRCVKRDGDDENIYESIDEDTLAKLRQNLDADTLALGLTECGMDHSKDYANSKINQASNVGRPYHLPGFAGGRGINMMPISLLEEKEALRESGLASPTESHYVEMHGIVSRTSSLSK